MSSKIPKNNKNYLPIKWVQKYLKTIKTISNMNKTTDPKQFATTVSPKFDNLIRTQAFKLRVSLREMLELYQQAYLEKIEREKQEKQEWREKQKKIIREQVKRRQEEADEEKKE